MALFARVTNKCLLINNCSNKLASINAESHKLFGFSRHCLLLRCCRGNIRCVAAFSKGHQIPSFAETNQNAAVGEDVGSFGKFLALRKTEAERSIIVQVQSTDSYRDLYSYCHEFGPIKDIKYYVMAKFLYFFIIEFENVSSQIALLNSATHLNQSEIIPVKSKMLWFRNLPMKKKQKKSMDIPVLLKIKSVPSHETTAAALHAVQSISEQMTIFYEMWKLDDIGIRLRFLTAHQMETAFSSLFSNISVLPFGSSVNGFGKTGCDLDLVINLETNKLEKVNSRMIFHTKAALSQERAQIQRSLETISSVMQHFIPGVTNVTKILNARVPLVKYDHKLTGLECDLTMSNMTAIYMSELLYLYGEAHPIVRPLVFTIRQWASALEITNSTPGTWITNFSLSLLVIFFLQCENILPSVNKLKNDASNSDVRLTDDGVDCTFIRDITKWPMKQNPSIESLDPVLANFFNFYADFDFTTRAISIRDGCSIYKPDTAPLHICNPLETSLNVSKNVNIRELMKFVGAVRNSVFVMNENNNSRGHRLIDLFSKTTVESRNTVVASDHRRVRVADLFEPDGISERKDGNLSRR